MDSNSTQNKELEINLKDAFKFILSKAWIVILTTIVAFIISYVYTNTTYSPIYASSAKFFIISETNVNDDGEIVPPITDWDSSRQYALSSPEFITIDFCQTIANRLNNENLENNMTAYDCSDYTGGKSFSEYYYATSGGFEKITAENIYSSITVVSNSGSCTMTVTCYSDNPTLAAIISNCIADSFENYFITILETNKVTVKVLNAGNIANTPSNAKATQNLFIGSFMGFALSCGILLLIFVLKDKNKSAEKQLDLDVSESTSKTEKEN